MALDIKNGDFITIDSTEYTITATTHFDTHTFGVSRNFAYFATESCSTTRRGAVASGLEPAPTSNLTGLSCTALQTVTADTRQTPITNTPVVLLETFITDGTDYSRLEIQQNRVG